MHPLTETKPITFRFTKVETQTYKMRYESGLEWADFILDYQDQSGKLSIDSANGSWNTHWASSGVSFKEFLLKVDMDDLAEKVGNEELFDAEKTVNEYKKGLLDCLERDYISEKMFASIIIELDTLDLNNNAKDFKIALGNLKNMRAYFGQGEPSLWYSVSLQFKQFWQNNWLPFMDVLKGELALNQS